MWKRTFNNAGHIEMYNAFFLVQPNKNSHRTTGTYPETRHWSRIQRWQGHCRDTGWNCQVMPCRDNLSLWHCSVLCAWVRGTDAFYCDWARLQTMTSMIALKQRWRKMAWGEYCTTSGGKKPGKTYIGYQRVTRQMWQNRFHCDFIWGQRRKHKHQHHFSLSVEHSLLL